MQNRIGQLLKDLQCILNLHFADGDPDGVAAGDGLNKSDVSQQPNASGPVLV
jgi:hypothetical protein